MSRGGAWARAVHGTSQAEAVIDVYRDGEPEYGGTICWQDHQIVPTILRTLWPEPRLWSGGSDPGEGRSLRLKWRGREWEVKRGAERGTYTKEEITQAPAEEVAGGG